MSALECRNGFSDDPFRQTVTTLFSSAVLYPWLEMWFVFLIFVLILKAVKVWPVKKLYIVYEIYI